MSRRWRIATALPLVLLAACQPGDDPPTDVITLRMQRVFSFAILADPHILGASRNDDRLLAALDWITAHQDERDIELALVVGDIGWGQGLDRAAGYLAGFELPVVPILGDNEVHAGDDARFEAVYAPHFEDLSTKLSAWERAPTPLWSQELQADMWLQNTAFSHRGVRFIGLDVARRGGAGWLGELGTLHELDGGTLSWLGQQLDALEQVPGESVVIFSHIPLQPVFFSLGELQRVAALTAPHRDAVIADYAGHVHVNTEVTMDDAGFDVFATAATHGDPTSLRVVEVWSDGVHVEHHQEVIELPVSG